MPPVHSKQTTGVSFTLIDEQHVLTPQYTLFGLYKMSPLLHIFDIPANDRNRASGMCTRNVIQYLWLVAACHTRVGGNYHNV